LPDHELAPSAVERDGMDIKGLSFWAGVADREKRPTTKVRETAAVELIPPSYWSGQQKNQA
jgi:hypothetical protein